MTPKRRVPTEAERRAIQQALNAGDLKRADELLAGIRRRLMKSNRNRSGRSADVKAAATKKVNANSRSQRSKRVTEVRTVGTTSSPDVLCAGAKCRSTWTAD